MKLPDYFCEYEYIDFVSKHMEMASSPWVSRDEHYEWLSALAKFAHSTNEFEDSDYTLRVIRETQAIAREFLKDLAEGKICVEEPEEM